MKVIIVVAVSENNLAIGKRGALPWYLSDDLKHFKKLTLGHHVVMGRKTFESIGKPLKGRTNIVVSHTIPVDTQNPELIYVSSPEDAIKIGQKNQEDMLFVIGGGTIYNRFLQIADEMYITTVKHEVECADTYFPTFEVTDWQEISLETFEKGSNNEHAFSIRHYVRK